MQMKFSVRVLDNHYTGAAARFKMSSAIFGSRGPNIFRLGVFASSDVKNSVTNSLKRSIVIPSRFLSSLYKKQQLHANIQFQIIQKVEQFMYQVI